MPPPLSNFHLNTHLDEVGEPDLMQIAGMVNGETANALIMSGLITEK